jgi:DNA-binding transcriptional ArsR family regulator
MTKQAVSRHIQVLETAGLVTRTRDGQRRPCNLRPAALEELTSWIDTYRFEAERRFRRLDAVLETVRAEENRPAENATSANTKSNINTDNKNTDTNKEQEK